MKPITKRVLALVTALTLTISASAMAADGVSFDGSVIAGETVAVTAGIGGTAANVAVSAGQRVKAGDVILTLETTKVYASRAGKVTGVFVKPGDSVSAVETQYGAVLYIEPKRAYTVSASTQKAYAADENKMIHIGETVYLAGINETAHKGAGVVTAVDGSSYTVEVTSGAFTLSETVMIYRNSAYTTISRLGRGTVSRVNPVAVTGAGSVYKMHVKDGDEVQAGDVLFETLDGEYDAYRFAGNTVVAPASGILSSVDVSEGASLTKGGAVATIYPDDGLRIEIEIAETDLAYIREGDNVTISFLWNEDAGAQTTGVVEEISYVSTQSDNGASYAARIHFQADKNVRVGMTALVGITDVKSDAAAISDAAE